MILRNKASWKSSRCEGFFDRIAFLKKPECFHYEQLCLLSSFTIFTSIFPKIPIQWPLGRRHTILVNGSRCEGPLTEPSVSMKP